MTTIGIISDIHADIDALERALQLLKQQDVDEIWCAGDLVDRGADGNAVVTRIRHEQIPTVQGNHDYTARRAQEQMVNDLRFMEYFDENPELGDYAHQMIISSELSEVNLTYLDYLPPARKFERDGFTIELTHANTFDQMTYIYPNSRPALFHETINATVADIIILGHTHKPMKVYKDGELRIINSGSVSRNYGVPDQSCGILTLPDRNFSIYDLGTGQAVPVATINLDETR